MRDDVTSVVGPDPSTLLFHLLPLLLLLYVRELMKWKLMTPMPTAKTRKCKPTLEIRKQERYSRSFPWPVVPNEALAFLHSRAGNVVVVVVSRLEGRREKEEEEEEEDGAFYAEERRRRLSASCHAVFGGRGKARWISMEFDKMHYFHLRY